MAEKKIPEYCSTSSWLRGMMRAYPKEVLLRSKLADLCRPCFEALEKEKKEKIEKTE